MRHNTYRIRWTQVRFKRLTFSYPLVQSVEQHNVRTLTGHFPDKTKGVLLHPPGLKRKYTVGCKKGYSHARSSS
jgi:hypothetical protein